MKNINILNNLNSGKTSSYFTTNGTKEFTCENDGYVDNVVIEGETLVNLIRTNLPVEVWDNNRVAIKLQDFNYLEGTYALFNLSDKTIVFDIGEATTNNWSRTFALDANKVKTFNINNGERIFNVNGLLTDGWENNDTSKNEFRNSIVLLEGDHTDKPISYFEGLKSVGQGDKIEVLSCNEDTQILKNFTKGLIQDSSGNYLTNADLDKYLSCLDYVPVLSSCEYFIDFDINKVYFYDSAKKYISYTTLNTERQTIVGNNTFKTPDNCAFIRFRYNLENNTRYPKFATLCKKHDKKQISTTLRSLPNGVKDTIEKRGNKYVKVQRCGEVTLNGSEDYALNITQTSTLNFVTTFAIPNKKTTKEVGSYICNNFKIVEHDNAWDKNVEGVHSSNNALLFINVSKSKLSSQDVNGFKTWLQTSPLTVVYELATPQIIELPNFNPQTFEGENTLIINSGVIQCDASFDVCEGIRSELDVIKDKVSSLDDNVKNNLGSEISNEINTIKNTVNNNTNNIGNLTTKVNNGQNYKLTRDDGAPKAVDGGTFDDIKTTGIYTCTSNVGGAKPIPNYGGYYHLEVINADNNDDKWITQRATIFEGTGHGIQVYTRICQYGTWTHWGRNIVDGQATKMTEDHGACRGIPNNNANDIDITGFWMGQKVINAPSVPNEWIYIESLVHNSLYQVQTATELHNSSNRWTRHKTGGNWSEWRSL